MELDLENSGLACELCGVVLSREGDVHVELVADVLADDLLLEARDELTGTESEVVLLSLAAFERFVVDITVEVDDDDIAVLSRAVGNLNLAGVALLGVRDFIVGVLVGSLTDGLCYRDADIIGDLDLRLYVELRLEGDAVVVDGDNVELGLGNHLEILTLDGVSESGVNDLVESLIIKYALAVHLLDDMLRRLALAEAGDTDAADILLVRLVASRVKCCLVRGEFNLDHIGLGFVYIF